MTVVLKPPGRGNWTPLRIDYTGPQVLPLLVRVGECITLAGVVFRVVEVRP
jgi:hypothetical protein